ncbi:hypothetical protein RIF29_13830 [Crotalaria pallida]|uniref:Uncharacterized protein n=1 Tax=Crotalaria pallida TaxID=3830 RepID=A0AAN9FFJ0_CROPI
MARGRRHLHPLSISHLPYLPHSHHYTDENRGGHRYQPLRLSWKITPLPSLNVEDRYREDNIWVFFMKVFVKSPKNTLLMLLFLEAESLKTTYSRFHTLHEVKSLLSYMASELDVRRFAHDVRWIFLLNLDSDKLKPNGWDNMANETPVIHSFSDYKHI